ncbi:TetR/AcrR family transcriptional regulator [Solicola gregarius]|uniref:TetR/AcrR family transcriptional regulator n=1 Tax=Solicola gregarius TaxID=2908642 RepID=A0AA46TER0_9ACTN|nr:TetR/AcrR family transcriptional regulator [Solicola gregarius]UYM03514.1 TetR/AcrR family transcriptional regulator [Solicola gregarius]
MSDAREVILRAAARCIARSGVRGLRVLDVASEAGVSSGLLYYHFGDRDGLLAATLGHINDTALGHRARGANAGSATERLVELLVEEVADADDVRDQATAWNEIRAVSAFTPDLSANLMKATAAWQSDIAAAVREAQAADGVAAAADADALAVALTALVEGIAARWIGGDLDTLQSRTILRDTTLRLLGTKEGQR